MAGNIPRVGEQPMPFERFDDVQGRLLIRRLCIGSQENDLDGFAFSQLWSGDFNPASRKHASVDVESILHEDIIAYPPISGYDRQSDGRPR